MKRVLCVLLTLCLTLTAAAVFPLAAQAADDGATYAVSDTAAVKAPDDVISEDADKDGSDKPERGEMLDPLALVKQEAVESIGTARDKNIQLAPTGAGVTWKLSGTTLTISGSGDMSDLLSDDYDYPWSIYADTVKSLVIGKGITETSIVAFNNFSALESITFSNTVTTIGDTSFYKCTSLKKVVLPTSVKTIQLGAFAGCENLTEINLENVNTIENYAFQKTGLKNLKFGKDLKNLGGTAFDMTDFESVFVDAANPNYCSEDGVLYAKSKNVLIMYPPQKAGQSFTVPSTVKTLAENAFCYNKNLTSLSLGSVVFIHDGALWGMAKLRAITFPNTVRELGECSCGDCDALTEISLPASVTKIGNACFAECDNLVSFSAAGLKEIPFQAFLNDFSLTNVQLPVVERIYRIAFYGCYSLEQVSLPKTTQFVHARAFHQEEKLSCANPEMRKYGENGLRQLQDVSISGSRNYQQAFAVLTLVNKERAKQGLKALVMNESLLETAMVRAGENAVLFSHTRPDGSVCFTADPLMHGENVAIGQVDAQDAMNSWMNSDGHRENILSESYTTIGVGCFEKNGATTWVQCFGASSDTKNCAKPSDRSVSQTISLATGTFDQDNGETGMIFGSGETYAYNFTINTNENAIDEGKTTKVFMSVYNPGFPYSAATLNNTGITWSSSDNSIATVTSGGVIKGTGNGCAKITAALKYFSAAAEIRVHGMLKAPVLTSANSVYSGIAVKWNAVDDAFEYRVFRKDNGKWTKLGDTSALSFTDKTFKAGASYTYTVRCISIDGKKYISPYDTTGKTATYITAPTVKKLENINSGTRLTWSKVSGAAKYRVFVKTSSGWAKFADTTGLTYLNKNVKSGKSYTYTLRAMNASGQFISGFDPTGRKYTFIAAPAVPKLTNSKSGVVLKWTKPAGSGSIRIFRKTGSGSWTKLADTTATAYTDTSAKNGVTYVYTLRCVNAAGTKYFSAYNTAGAIVKCVR